MSRLLIHSWIIIVPITLHSSLIYSYLLSSSPSLLFTSFQARINSLNCYTLKHLLSMQILFIMLYICLSHFLLAFSIISHLKLWESMELIVDLCCFICRLFLFILLVFIRLVVLALFLISTNYSMTIIIIIITMKRRMKVSFII